MVGSPVSVAGVTVTVSAPFLTSCPARLGLVPPGDTLAEITATIRNVGDPYQVYYGSTAWNLAYGQGQSVYPLAQTCETLKPAQSEPVRGLIKGETATVHLEFSFPGNATGLRLVYSGAPVGARGSCGVACPSAGNGQIVIDLKA